MKTLHSVGRGWRGWAQLLRARRAARPDWEQGEALRLCFVVDTATLGGAEEEGCLPEAPLSGFLRHPVAPEAR